MQRKGSTNDICREINNLLKYFNYEDNYSLYVTETNTSEKETNTLKNDTIRINDKINHNKYGLGKIINISKDKIIIKFDNKQDITTFSRKDFNYDLIKKI